MGAKGARGEMGGGRDVVQGEEKTEKVIAPAEPEAQAACTACGR